MSELDVLEDDLKIASRILEWEIGDIWGHVGTRLPSGEGVTLKLFRRPEEAGVEDWIVRFDYAMNKISGVARPPTEAAIYTEIFKARPDVNAIVHCHAPMCIALGLAGKKVDAVHMQSSHFAGGVPIFPKPIFIIDEAEGKELADAMRKDDAIVITGHGVVLLGKSIDEVCIRTLYLERTARIMAVAYGLGFQGLTDEFRKYMEGTKEKHRQYLNKVRGPRQYIAEWSYYKDKVRKGEWWNRGSV
ncbi:MAG: class II aldolase/adducin family protein [Deltaproteobacteria bacterium]|nr:class II aldolase/adducin family protein [Deltaproteobacteria bacterium]